VTAPRLLSFADVTSGALWAASDLHVAYDENRAVVDGMRPESDGDWLLVAGDVAETVADVEWALGVLSRRYARVVWAPGNHELWSPGRDPVALRGEARYRHLVEVCRGLGVVTPEDPYPVWAGDGGPVRVAPLFTLYDYTFRPAGVSQRQALAGARADGVVLNDEYLLHADPFEDKVAWCHARVAETERRLAALDDDLPTVLVNHWPLRREPTEALYLPQIALWCGTERTADWHRRFRAAAVVYGHLHIPRTTSYDGVRFEEVSLGYPRERARRSRPTVVPRRILPT
jgi:3',5'-cyclic AMP phosphodiesterase CpdA